MPSNHPREFRLPCWVWAAPPFFVASWLRLRGIGTLEAFVDEAGNILAALDPRVWAIVDPLGQGRPWLSFLFRPAGWFPIHALESARMMCASAGLCTMVALGGTLYRLGGRAAALCGLWIWAVLPFAVFHERLALQDPFVTALLAWAMAILVGGRQAEEKRRWIWLLAAGAFFGTALLQKISAVFALPWLGLLYLALPGAMARSAHRRALGMIAAGTFLLLLSVGPDLIQLGQHSTRFGSLPTLAADDFFGAALGRLKLWLAWYGGYGGWPLGVLSVAALVQGFRTRSRLVFAATLGAGLSLLVAALFYARPFARYLLPDQLPLVLFLALGLGTAFTAMTPRLARNALLVGVIVALGAWLNVSRQIAGSPATAPLPPDEISQYVTGPWSGRGLGEVRRFLAHYADKNNVRCLVLTHRFQRPGCYGLMLTELADPRIGVVPFTVYEPNELASARSGLLHASAGQPVAFFLLYEGSLYPAPPWLDAPGSRTHRVLTTPHGDRDDFTLFQFEP